MAGHSSTTSEGSREKRPASDLLNVLGISRAGCNAEQAQAILARLGELIADPLWILDARRRAIYLNEAFETTWGRSRDWFYRDWSRWLRCIHPEDQHRIREHAAQSRHQQELIYPDYRIIRPDGSVRWIRVCERIGLDAGGQVQMIVGTARDITKEREAGSALASAKEEAERANHAKDQFLAMLSHELRTPLTPVLAVVSDLEQEIDLLPTDLREDFLMIRRNIELEARLIDDLLDLTRIARGKLHLEPLTVDGHELIRRAVQISQADFEMKNVQLICRLIAPRTTLLADPARVQQVFWNVIKNALQHTPGGGRVEIATENHKESLVTHVTDTGAGIDPAFLGRIFEAFEQENRQRRPSGLGLGLAISRTVLDLHGGSITAESEGQGRGATFTITLPLADEPVAKTSETPVPGTVTATSLRILLVEDHPSTLLVLSRLLRKQRHSVITAHALAEARALLAAAPFDLLITDIGLPDGSGLQLGREPRLNAGMRAIALSGFGMDGDVAAARTSGFDAHITKPIDMDRLKEAIRDVMRG